MTTPSAACAREAARHDDGRFGLQARSEVDVDLVEQVDPDVAWLEEQLAANEATDYLRTVLNDGVSPHWVAPRDVPRHPVNECTGADLPPIAYLGKSAYDPELVEPIKNIVGFSKPSGGTWLSPLHEDGTTDWTRHCKVIRYDAAVRGRRVHPIGLHPEARVLKIDTMEDLRGAIDTHGGIQREGDDQLRPDFEEIARHYDALWLTRRGMNATWISPGSTRRTEENLNAWELESVLILNPDSVHST